MPRSKQISGSPELGRVLDGSGLLRQGDRGPEVALLQASLIRAGFPMPKSTAGGTRYPDGIFGPETKETAQRFQNSEGLKADGLIGPATLGRLDAVLLRFEADHVTHRHGPRPVREFRATVQETTPESGRGGGR